MSSLVQLYSTSIHFFVISKMLFICAIAPVITASVIKYEPLTLTSLCGIYIQRRKSKLSTELNLTTKRT